MAGRSEQYSGSTIQELPWLLIDDAPDNALRGKLHEVDSILSGFVFLTAPTLLH